MDDMNLEGMENQSLPEQPENAAPEMTTMEPETYQAPQRPVNPRRRKRSQVQIFKEAYLPAIIAGAAALMILIFIVGAIGRGLALRRQNNEASRAAASLEAERQNQLAAAAQDVLNRAEAQAAGYDYAGAIEIIDSFPGNINDFDELVQKRQEYETQKETMVAWSDPSKIYNLSFQMLIADPSRAFKDAQYGDKYNQNFVTIGEFQKILQQLYDNGYILVELDDFVTLTTNDAGIQGYAAKTMYLPAGKTPLMITQTNVNYDRYMIDGDNDGKPDKSGAGFASRLVLDSNGKIVSEMVDAQGNTITGAYDLVPILDAFIEAHPDFSYGGAKAILAVSGHEGLFGYRTAASDKEKDEDAYNEQVASATEIINALRDDGYVLACYTYGNVAYGMMDNGQIQEDLGKWNNEVVPILGETDIMVFAKNSEIVSYTGNEYATMRNAGFHFYLGFSSDGAASTTVTSEYVRQCRLMVTGSTMQYHTSWFGSLFDPKEILDSLRGVIPK